MAKRKKLNPLQRWLRKNFAKKASPAKRQKAAQHKNQEASGRRTSSLRKPKKKTSGCLLIFLLLLGAALALALFFAYHYYQDRQRYQKAQEEKRIAREHAAAEEEIRKAAFLEETKTLALECKKSYGILPSIAAAQAILESNWGRSQLSLEYNNYFGIKSLKESDQRVLLPTYEYKDGEKIQMFEPFRAYDSMEQSFQHYGQLLSQAKIYQKVIQAKAYEEAAQALYDSGYSTDPDYPKKLIDIIRSEKLETLDGTGEKP